MRNTMRQLLSRKSHGKMAGDDDSQHNSKLESFPPPRGLWSSGDRVFPLRNHTNTRDGQEANPFPPTHTSTAERAESLPMPPSVSQFGSLSILPERDDKPARSDLGSLRNGGSSHARSDLSSFRGRDDHPTRSDPGNLRERGSSHALSPPPVPRSVRSSSGTRVPSRNGTVYSQKAQSLGESLADPEGPRKVSQRTQYAAPSNSSTPRVITGEVAEQTRSRYRACEDEPIHIPGAIQSFGALIALQYSDHGDLEVRIASENSRRVLGYGPEQLFALGSFLDVLKPDDRDEMTARVHNCLSDANVCHDESRLDVFQITFTFPYEPDTRLWCAVHLSPNTEATVVCEFEEYADAFYLRDVGAAQVVPVTPVHLADYECTPEEFKKSTTSASTPLPALEIARKKTKKEFSSLDVFSTFTQAQKQLTDCTTVQHVQEVTVGLVAELTGFHRVMSYRFDAQANGCVEAEMLNPKASVDIFRGLHYPASDIPPQARELYKINRIRLLHDRDAETARLVSRSDHDFSTPLDLTHSYLRAMSPIHNKYLQNMGVRSTMSISLVIGGELWGLIACHGYGDQGIHVSLPIRELCRNIGDCAALHVQRLMLEQRINARRLPANQNPATFVATSSTDLLGLLDADFALLNIEDRVRAIGRMEPYKEAQAIMTYLQHCKFNTIKSTQSISTEFPGLSFPGGIKTLAGLLLIPLNVAEGEGGQNDFLVFFRKGQLRHVKWAGNPHGKTMSPNSDYLQPRTSFHRWIETVAGTSREWTDDQLDTASVLGLLYGRFVETWRLKGTGNNAGPPATPSSTTASAVPSVPEADESTTSQQGETFNLKHAAQRSLDALKKETKRKSLLLSTHLAANVPGVVRGNSDCFMRVLAYFTHNGFKQCNSVVVSIDVVAKTSAGSVVGIKVEDSGPGMTEQELDDVFAEFEKAQNEDDWPLPKSQDFNPSAILADGTTNLALIARYVQSVDGQIAVSSEVGKGTVFGIELPYENAADQNIKPKKVRRLFITPDTTSARNSIIPQNPPPTKELPSVSHARNSRSGESSDSRNASSGSASSGNGATEPDNKTPSLYPQSSITTPDVQSPSNIKLGLSILVADGDNNSLRTMDEKLSAWGCSVDFAGDGQEAHDRFAARIGSVDVIILESKLPLVNGQLATRMIRLLEKEQRTQTSRRQSINSEVSAAPSARSGMGSFSRVPIFIVGKDLDEDSRFDYIQIGVDGWMLKPVDWKRLQAMLEGVKNSKMRREALFVSGNLKKGGWFLP